MASPDNELVTLCKTCHGVAHNKAARKDTYYMVFQIDYTNLPINLTADRLAKLLAVYMEFDTGIVHLTQYLKDEMASTLKIKAQTLTNALTDLTKAGVIKITKGKLAMNPYWLWKGTIHTRDKLLKTTKFKPL